MIRKIQVILAAALVVCSVMMLTACSESKVVLTTGFGSNEAFQVGSERATTTELMLYLTNIANQYEQVYGESLWTMSVDEDTTLLDNCKEVALAWLSQVKAMKLLAKEYEVVLSEEEEAAVQSAAAEYLVTLTESEEELLGITEGKIIEQIYSEKLLADKLYAYLIRDVNPEISDDEARIITVQHILLKTYTVDEHGNRQEMDKAEGGQIYNKAEEIRQMAIEGESFDALISKYSEDSKGTYSFGMGDLEESFETAAFALATDEIAPVVKTSHGYHIIKCISTLDREQTDLNKVKLLVSRKQEVFGNTYNQFVEQLEKRENLKVITTMELPDSSVVDTAELFTIYDSRLGGMFETEAK
ncbi:MAG: peptidylprolyl isomerase [Lachnospiraceae bacterium]|nr:peptidylprolyl isomerase [Lachnospiraceae bacterium]MBR4058522.1 peptidylprolyl isomerase [Lachnospiraceae bacterium]